MVDIRPFKAIRPAENLSAKVAALPYDVINSEEARVMALGNPYSYFHIDRAEIDLPPKLSPYDPAVYQKAATSLADFLKKGWLKKDDAPYFYLYQLTMNGRSQTGLALCASIDDYVAGKIKKHEFTRPEKEVDRINHIKACDANTSPIFLAYRHEDEIQKIMKAWQENHEPTYNFDSYHDVNHKVWVIDDTDKVATLTKLFAAVPALYIADGHHRTESAVKVGLEKRVQKNSNPESDHFLAIVFPENELAIWEYNRVVNVPVTDTFLDQLKSSFTIEKTTKTKPDAPGQIQMYLARQWYTLSAKETIKNTDPVKRLDVSLLQDNVFAPIFGIKDVRVDKRIDFIGGIRGPEELVKLVDSGAWQVAFSLYPTAMTDLLDVADAGKIMPPKSTWFEPKLLSGLFVHDLETK
ncbi:DUF1015 domain-containing protein [Enterococcus sp. MJM12]|uniref:DUF1015 domain-containing protein n=1 Tax=Candidatus Enterococcus myersii TaxID=2815322 RepID=A0ABS3H412_9ENTE|nr:DUF1015 family protein [Enterococcus sp. MJM12]MBO0448194.1 DUF1015 domain-containing protein [Enterococcus sp. MJM12]